MKINKNSIRLHITSITWNISHLYLSVTLDVYLVVGELFSLNYRDPHLLRTAYWRQDHFK